MAFQANKQNDSGKYNLVSNYKYGYRNKEDITNLPPGVLIVGSQNALINDADRIQIRQGYALDGDVSTTLQDAPSSFDWMSKINGEIHMRAGGLTVAGNDGKLQYRYVDSNGTVTWRDLITGATSTAYNFTTFWNTTESVREVLFVNGAPQIQKWNGATTTLSSAAATTLTKTGTDSWLDTGFYSSANKQVVINGTTYTYTGGENTTTLTGVTPDPSGEAANSVVHQAVVTTLNSSMTSITTTLSNGLIASLNNQVFVASLTSPVVWISKVNSYTDYSQSTPRQVGEGSSLILDDNVVAFKRQEQFMYVSCGKDLWYNINFELQASTVGVSYEQVNAELLKNGKQQGAISQAGVSHMKNNVIVITNEITIDMMGRLEGYFETPQTQNISDSIKNDIDSYDFTDASIYYWRFYILVAVPIEGLVLMYNLSTNTWEAPQTLPISRFYVVDGELYGHNYYTLESYKLFTGYADRVYPGFSGFPIDFRAIFSYQNYGSRSSFKDANAFYVEGYISANTTLNCTLTYELDGCATTRTFEIDGSDTQVVCISQAQGSLGKESLGKIKLGGSNTPSLTNLPPKFRAIPTFNNTPFFEASPSFSILGVDQRCELLAFGLNATESKQEPVSIKQ